MSKILPPGAVKEWWKRLKQEAESCQACPLYLKRNTPVLYRGEVLNPTWCFVAEAPGEEEDLSGRVFVGPAGKLFNRLLKDAGLHRESWIAINTLNCRPPKNKYPSRQIADICIKKFLWMKLDLIRPKVLVLMGAQAAKTVLPGKLAKISDAAGFLLEPALRFPLPSVKHLFVTYHPSLGLRKPVMIGSMRSHLRFFASVVKRS